jgi:hypothetical protein
MACATGAGRETGSKSENRGSSGIRLKNTEGPSRLVPPVFRTVCWVKHAPTFGYTENASSPIFISTFIKSLSGVVILSMAKRII